ncbi:hypothetical protein CRE_29088 [Caenorhabditis remanei]|uniref:Uncharacterized protein n=1 Tax=Caenorhabditis remanei TaxID=31234 RepID=E3MWC1_CAERE|nr:hypothetical protein CRE_29088 [Caenorhabditis remanei]
MAVRSSNSPYPATHVSRRPTLHIHTQLILRRSNPSVHVFSSFSSPFVQISSDLTDFRPNI